MFFGYLASTATCVAALMFLDAVVWRGSAGWGLGAGAAVLAGGVVWAFARFRSHGSDEDPITSPFANAGSSASGEAPGSPKRSAQQSLFGILTYMAMIPIATMVLLAVTVMLHQMSPG